MVHGKLSKSKGELKQSIKDFHQRKHNKRSHTIPALTQYKVIETKSQFSVVEVIPITGRTNQIRIHFAQIKHPLVGERKYAFARDYKLKFRRTALHAAQLEWKHPTTKKQVKVSCDLAQDLNEFINNN